MLRQAPNAVHQSTCAPPLQNTPPVNCPYAGLASLNKFQRNGVHVLWLIFATPARNSNLARKRILVHHR